MGLLSCAIDMFDNSDSTSPVRLGYRFSAVPEWITFHPDLTGEQVRLYSALCRFANHEQQAWPTARTLAEKTARSVASVHRDLAALAMAGAIRIEERFVEGRGQTSNLYHLAGDAPFEYPPLLTGEQGPLLTGEYQTRTTMNETSGSSLFSDEPAAVAAPASKAATDGLFEAFFEFWAGQPYSSGVTLLKSQRGRLNQAVKEAREVGITAEDVEARGERYRRTWPKMERTPQALLANWSRFAEDAEAPAGNPSEGRIDPSPPRNEPSACLHRALMPDGECAGCNTQVAYRDDDGSLKWLPGKAPPELERMRRAEDRQRQADGAAKEMRDMFGGLD